VRIALIHYHLLRGGVTSVIHHQARALRSAGDEVLLISGDAPQDRSGFPEALIPDLRYDSVRGEARLVDESVKKERAARLADELLRAMEKQWGSPADVVHVHNPLIRKNALLLPALRLLKDRGMRLLLQNHDFAEDFRPDVYIENESYLDNCHYGALNSRDFSFLHRSGLDPAGLHLMPNEVVPIEAQSGLERTRYLYPVRGIGRKNIGEALLLSMFIPKGRTIAITLPPTSHRDEPGYRHWKETAQALRLPVEFEVGGSASLPELLGSAVCALTTSVKEGFGFSFLEPWTAGRAVIGRRIDYVCKDFERSGVRFDDLYASINIPMVYLPPPILRKKMEQALISAFRAFGLEAPSYTLKMMTDEIFSQDKFDFGRLDQELQTDILQTIASNDAARRDLADANPFLAGLAARQDDEERIRTNRSCILERYGAAAITDMLRQTYRAVLEKPVTHRLSKSILLELFLDPQKLSLVGLGHD